MFEAARRKILQILRVPPEPHPPEGSAGSIKVFRAGRNFYRWQVIAWIFSHLGTLSGTLAGYIWLGRVVLRKAPAWVSYLWHGGEILGLIGFAIALPFTFLALKLNYELRWYMVTDRSLRIRRGVWSVEELTMTFANIQEIRVTAGPLQNYLGLADVEVHSAGGGSVGPKGERIGHFAAFEGVDNANEIRDLIVERLRQYRDSGLGDAHQVVAQAQAQAQQQYLALTHAQSESTVEAARLVLAEARALRAAL